MTFPIQSSISASPVDPVQDAPAPDTLRDEFLVAMRYAAASVAVVTTDGAAGRAGLTVSAVCSLSADPPSVLVCVHKASPVLPLIQGNGRLCVNLLAAEQTHVADSFAGRIARWRADRFACAEWDVVSGGCPALRGAQARLHCALAQQWHFGSHWILIGEIQGVDSKSDAGLLYVDRTYRQIGTEAPLREELYA